MDAQDKVASREGDCCTTSCKCSIHDLLSPEQEDTRTRYTTIPFMLTCKKSCRTFIGKGVYSDRNGDNSRYFGCVTTPILKAKKFVKEIGRHTSELQSRGHLVCRLLLEKTK